MKAHHSERVADTQGIITDLVLQHDPETLQLLKEALEEEQGM